MLYLSAVGCRLSAVGCRLSAVVIVALANIDNLAIGAALGARDTPASAGRT
jgi:hypothetical protein